jgi:hypothetical protein
MKLLTRLALFSTVLATAACSQSPGSQETAIPPPSSQAATALQANQSSNQSPSRLAQVVRLQSIGTTKEFLERTVGASVAETESEAQYDVDGCHVTVELDGRTVKSLAIKLDKGCRFDLAGVTGQTAPIPVDDSLVFATFEKLAGGAQYHSPCIEMCGNAFDPYVDALVPGFHANGFVDVVARATFVADDATSASMAWADQLKAAAGEDFVMNAQFNCDASHDDIPRNLFANVKVQEIIFGSGLDESRCQ